MRYPAEDKKLTADLCARYHAALKKEQVQAELVYLMEDARPEKAAELQLLAMMQHNTASARMAYELALNSEFPSSP